MAQQLVLVVDDDPAVRGVVIAMLSSGGYSAIAAADGITALELFRSRQSEIEVLLSDVEMPGVSGIELAQAVLAEHPNVRVLLMSGIPTAAELTRLPFLAKPFTGGQLCSTIAAVLDEPPPLFRSSL